MNTKDLSEMLKGCRPVKDKDGNIVVQSILNMQVVCLTTDVEYSMDDRFANPLTSLTSSNSQYGQISFSNNENKEVILPTQMAVITKQVAQNHGMIKAGYVSPKANVTYHDAGCVQGSQGGYFRGTQEFRMIPVSMREMLFDSIGKPNSYSRIYPAIEKLGRDTNSGAGNYLDVYFNKYDKKLEQFIAHFERPKNLIGIIVLIDGEIVAIDKFPSFTYAEQVWDLMIRDCYGSLAIISELQHKTSVNEFTQSYEELKKDNRTTVVDLLEKALKKTKERMTASVHEKIQEVLELQFDAELDTEGQSTSRTAPKSYVLKTEGYVGQVLTENEFNHLVSIIKRERFNPNAYRQISELRNKARKQKNFSL
ncbi:MAG: DUF6569 family protein [Candidatus Paceibacterota bacterium]